ncbi:MAG: hypothetical protein ACKV2T_26420 [Kofleriaceae bacterium]
MKCVALVTLAVVASGCPQRQEKTRPVLADPVASNDGNLVASIIAELQDDVLTSYERDEPPDIETGMIPIEIGGARIGVGPGDVLIAEQLERAPSRWPLRTDRDTRTEVRSKRLETHLARDLSAAWVFDELSWRIPMCERVAVIPLRITMLYARDGDRWVPIFEHMSFGHTPAPHPEGLYGVRIPSKSVASSDFVDELSSAVSPVLSQQATPTRVATGPEAMLLGPDVEAEWHGLDVLGAKLAVGPVKTVEDRRIGYIGRTFEKATVAYWVGNVVADLPARAGIAGGKSRMRTTFVFERRRAISQDESRTEAERKKLESQSCGDNPADCRWVLVQGHVSEPIGDSELAAFVFGTALLSPNLESGEPLSLTCDDGSPTPAAGSTPRAAPAK